MSPDSFQAGDFYHGDFATLSRMKLLVIDDEPANIALLEALLEEGGFTKMRSISDSRLAHETIQEFEPDIVLLDLMMPAPNGITILEKLRSETRSLFLPVVVLTADANEETKIRALRAGATDFLLKPFDHIEVLLRIANLLETRRLHLQLDLERAALADAVYARTDELRKAQSQLQATEA